MKDLKKARQALKRARELVYDAYNRVEERGSFVSAPLRKLALDADEALNHLDQHIDRLKGRTDA